MHYFAFGSNMNLPHLRHYAASLDVDSDGISRGCHATLHDHRLRTNYVSRVHKAGACNIEPTPGQTVEGLVMQISPAIRKVLQAKEGWPHRYQEVEVEVLTSNQREPLRAITYVVAPNNRLDVDMPVLPKYRSIVLAGAQAVGVSEAYQQELHELLQVTNPLRDLVRRVWMR